MHLSEHLQSYPETTCVLVTDRLHARFYLAKDRDITLTFTKTNENLKIEDSERYEGSFGGGNVFQSQDEKLDDREAKTFYRELTLSLFEMKQKHEYEKWILLIPQNDKNIFVDLLHTDLKSLLQFVIGKELTGLPEDQLFNRLDEERKELR